MSRRKREPGWYIIDNAHGNRCLRGPYDYDETAVAVRREMERSWNEGDEFHPTPDTRNLCIVSTETLDELESTAGPPKD